MDRYDPTVLSGAMDNLASLPYFQRMFTLLGKGIMPPVWLQNGPTCIENSISDLVTMYLAILTDRPLRFLSAAETIQIINDCVEAFPGDLASAYLEVQSQIELRILSAQDLVDNVCPSADAISYSKAATYLAKTGVCFESAYPRREDSTRQPRNAFEGLVTRVKVDGFEAIADPSYENVINHLHEKGPLVSCIDVTDRFVNFRNMYHGVSLEEGVYSHQDDDEFLRSPDEDDDGPSRHSVVIVGYQKETRSLLIKNSYDCTWGYLGFALVDFDCFSYGLFAYPVGLSIIRAVGEQIVAEVSVG